MSLNHREVTEKDKEQLEKWVAADPDHSGLLTADFWIPPRDAEGNKIPGTKCMSVEDENGVAFYLRLDNVMRVYVQFPPDAERDSERIKKALEGSFLTIAGNAHKLGYKEMIFNSVSKSLIRFFRKFGFNELKDTFQVEL